MTAVQRCTAQLRAGSELLRVNTSDVSAIILSSLAAPRVTAVLPSEFKPVVSWTESCRDVLALFSRLVKRSRCIAQQGLNVVRDGASRGCCAGARSPNGHGASIRNNVRAQTTVSRLAEGLHGSPQALICCCCSCHCCCPV